MNSTKLKKMFVDNVALPSIGIAICLLLWCFLSWATWDTGTNSSDFPSPITTWTDSSKYFASPFSHNDAEGFDGIGLEIWRSLKLVGMGYGMAIIAAVPMGFLLGGSYRFAACSIRYFKSCVRSLRLHGFRSLGLSSSQSDVTTKRSMQHNCSAFLRLPCAPFGQPFSIPPSAFAPFRKTTSTLQRCCDSLRSSCFPAFCYRPQFPTCLQAFV